MKRLRLAIPSEAIGSRLDAFLLERCPGLTHAHLCRLIRKRTVRVAGRTAPSIGYRLDVGDRELSLPAIESGDPTGHRILRRKTPPSNEMDIRTLIVYEDEDLIALNKPSGIAVQGGSGLPISIDSLLWQLQNPELRLVHRLDKGCSGVLLLAKSRPISRILSVMFEAKHAQKTYLAWVSQGMPSDPEWKTITTDLIRTTNRHGWEISLPMDFYQQNRCQFGPALKQMSSETRWRSLRTNQDGTHSVLELMPMTGRKHQLRSMCAFSLAAPIVGDSKYGGVPAPRLMLHCRSIQIPHPSHDNDTITISAPIPDDFNLPELQIDRHKALYDHKILR